MGKLIEVKEEVVRDKYSLLNIKRFQFGNLLIERPLRALDAKNIRYEHVKTFFSNHPIIFEKSIFVNLGMFRKIVETNDNRKIRDHFDFPYYAKEFPRYISITFTFNPFRVFESREVAENNLESYLMYYQEYSASSLLVPNIKVYRMAEETKRVKEVVVTIDEFIDLVDTMYNILGYCNDKPIFVPFSLRFSMADIDKLADHYIKREYYNIWIDFEGSAITEDKIARVRKFIRKFDERGLFNRLVIIVTNIRREIISNVKKDHTPASDVLATLIGANIVGVNREPMRPIEGKVVIEHDKLLEHKARIFDYNTYYYFKVTKANYLDQETKSKILMSKETNIAINTKLVDDEFNRQAEVLINKDDTKEYISSKKMLQEYKQGSLLKALQYSYHVEKQLTEWF
ncbi:MAG: hypothetical protein QXD38_07825 [Ignisphaera sp.]|uniref:hypothetical protein n=1 Tax=Thermofilum sp. TaxID=1961369 RepID=UPI00315E65C8